MAGIHLSADLLLPWPVVAASVSDVAIPKKLEIQSQLKVGIKQMSECLEAPRYTKAICTIVSFYCVKSIVLL